ncbi:MAG: SdpI family protein [Clostridia bacterium]|nr:SdpI family protein [Clostridia bacterium]
MFVFVGVVIFVLGFILPKCKQNYTIGIRLPWTLHDEENWNKTHKLAGKLWIISGILMTVAGLLKFTILFMITIFVIVIIPTVYSYLLYRSKI